MGNKKIYGLIGYPLGHSFSKDFFNKKFSEEAIHAEYLNFELPSLNRFPELSQMPGMCGLNVTIPYKQEIIPYLSDIDTTAEEIGAVNVLKRVGESGKIRWKGYNSDVAGFRESIRPLLLPTHKHALIFGSGGASKAVEYALRQLGITYKTVSRNPKPGQLAYKELNAFLMAAHTVLINTTPLGMFPNTESCPDIPYRCISPKHLCYDLIYNPEETLFLKKAKQQGAIVKNGKEMLVRQAIEAWEIWNRPLS